MNFLYLKGLFNGVIFNGVASSFGLQFPFCTISHFFSMAWDFCTPSSFRFQTIRDIQFKLILGYSKIIGSRGHFRRQALTKLYSTFYDHSVLFCAGFYIVRNKGDVKRVKTDYYGCCKFFLYLPRSFRNRRLTSKYQATDLVLSVEKLSSKSIDEAPIRLGLNNNLIRLFC